MQQPTDSQFPSSTPGSLLPLDEDTKLCLSLINAPTSTGNLTLPGASAESTTTLVEKLKHNFLHHNVFFDGKIFHNHAMDHILAVYALGGSPEAIEEAYISHDYNEAVRPSPHRISDDNFMEHLGDPDYFYAYTVYFCKELKKSSPTEVLNKYIFGPAYNSNTNAAKEQPAMLDRLLAGVLHPIIHVGYGVEYGITQQIADGLSYTAVHPAYQKSILPDEFFNAADPLLRGLSSTKPSASQPPFLSLLSELLSDPRLTAEALKLPHENYPGGPSYEAVLRSNAGQVVMELVNKWYDSWIVGVSDEELEDRLEGMVEDVLLGGAVMYGIGGYAAKGDRVFNADFITMHFVTSANFIPCLCLRPEHTRAQALNPPLPLSSRLLLLRAYLSSTMLWLLTRPSPPIASITSAIPAFYAATDPLLALAPPSHAYAPGAPPKREFFDHTRQKTMPAGSRAWPRVFINAAAHPNEHLPKLVRALGAADTWYGRRARGEYGGTLEGSELLDGTVFIRCALLSMERLGWAVEDGPKVLWDRDGYRSAAE